MTMAIQGASQALTNATIRINSETESKATTSKEQEASGGSASSSTTQTAKTSGTQAAAGAGEASTGSSSSCANCGATLASDASVCGKCGAAVESASDQLLKELAESGLKANSTDNGIGTMAVQGLLAQQEEDV